MKELKPCPFCGGTNVDCMMQIEEIFGMAHSVMCYECGASTGQYATEQEAIEAWNRRV